MREVENNCVDCGLPCLGSSCPHRNAVFYYCDICGEYAEYKIDGKDLCDKCAEEYLNEIFEDLSASEKAEALGLSYETYLYY